MLWVVLGILIVQNILLMRKLSALRSGLDGLIQALVSGAEACKERTQREEVLAVLIPRLYEAQSKLR